MKHLGDITKIHGYDIPVVDVITGGSPCQDLSVAGKRAGLAGERSGLFMEQIRIVKEMRERDGNSGRSDRTIRPRYMVWENVVGATSSGTPKGEDFRIVLEEVARVSQKNAIIPGPPRGGWSNSGAIVGDGWSIAWRIHDAQFWGVPQRRRRIALLADFNGDSAPRILFDPQLRRKTERTKSDKTVGDNRREPRSEIHAECESLSGDSEQGEETREGIAEGAGGSSDKPSVRILNPSDSQGNQVADSHGVYPASRGCGGAGYQQGYIREPGGSSDSSIAYGIEPGAAQRMNPEGRISEELSPTLRSNMGDNQAAVAYIIGGVNSEGMKSPNPNVGIYKTDTTRTLDLNGGSPACNQGGGCAYLKEMALDHLTKAMDISDPKRCIPLMLQRCIP